MWIKDTHVNELIHPDLNFVHDGYSKALAKLMKVLQSKSEPHVSDPHVARVRNDLLSTLELKFDCLVIDSAYRHQYYRDYQN
ncbi:hypothetical protein FRC12_000679 [Ceratobasidium sp. 428]|nr:hypothetical protein FRC12_000679 [Ceratobasidium sp. 428]